MAALLHESSLRESLGRSLRHADSSDRTVRWISEAFLRERLGTAAGHVGLVFCGQAGLSAARFAALLLLARVLPGARFDECAIYTASSLVIGNLCELGINISCLKFAAHSVGEDWLRIASRFLMLRLLLTAVISVIGWGFSPVVAEKLLQHSEFTGALRLACGSAALGSFSSFALALLQSRLEFPRMARLSAAAAILQILPVLLGRTAAPGIVLLFGGDILSRLSLVAGNCKLLSKLISAAGLPGPRPSWRQIAGFANWITISTAIGALYNYIPSVVLSRWAAVSELGRFSLGMSLAAGVALLINTVSTVVLPEAVAADTSLRRRNYLQNYLPGSFLLTALLLAATWLCGPLAAHLFPSAMHSAVRVFEILATAQLLLLVANPIQFLLYGEDRPHWCTAGDALITLLFGLMAARVASTYGAIGVACALLVSQTAVKAAIVWIVVRRR